MPDQHSVEAGRKVSARHHVRTGAEGVAARADPGPFHRLVQAEQAQLGGMVAPAGPREAVPEGPVAHATLKGEPREGHAHTPNSAREGGRLVEHVQVRMAGEQWKGDPGALVVARHQEDGNTHLGDPAQRSQALLGDTRWDPAAVEEVPRMHDQVDVASQGGSECPLEASLEIRTPPAPRDARPARCIEPDMGIGEQQDPDAGHAGDPRRRA